MELGFEDLLSPNISKVFGISENWSEGINVMKPDDSTRANKTDSNILNNIEDGDKNSIMSTFRAVEELTQNLSSLVPEYIVDNSSLLPVMVFNEVADYETDSSIDSKISIDDLITFPHEVSLSQSLLAAVEGSNTNELSFPDAFFYLPDSSSDITSVTPANNIIYLTTSSPPFDSAWRTNSAESLTSNQTLEDLDGVGSLNEPGTGSVRELLTGNISKSSLSCSSNEEASFSFYDHNYSLTPCTLENKKDKDENATDCFSSVVEEICSAVEENKDDGFLLPDVANDVCQSSNALNSSNSPLPPFLFDFSGQSEINLKFLEEILAQDSQMTSLNNNLSKSSKTTNTNTCSNQTKSSSKSSAPSTTARVTASTEEEECDDLDESRRKYLERRKKNNIASRRSRQIRKTKYSEMEAKADALEKENEELKIKITKLEMLTAEMKETLIKRLKGA